MSTQALDSFEYKKYLINSTMVNWDIDVDVVRFRTLDPEEKYLPDSLSKVNELQFLSLDEQKLLSQIQARTYVNYLVLIERCINSKILQNSRDHALGDQVALEAMVQFSQEELKHQQLFTRLEQMMDGTLPDGYRMMGDPKQAASAVLSRSSWAVLAWISHFEMSSLSHYQQSLTPGENVSELFRDVLRYHWLEEEQHSRLIQAEWDRTQASLSEQEIDQGVGDLIELLVEFEEILVEQATADAQYFIANAGREFTEEQCRQIVAGVISAYNWQHLGCASRVERSQKALAAKLDEAQLERLLAAISPEAVGHVPVNALRQFHTGAHPCYGLS